VDVRLVRILHGEKRSRGAGWRAEQRRLHGLRQRVRQEIAVFERQTAQPSRGTAGRQQPLHGEGTALPKRVRFSFSEAVFSEGDPQDTVAFYSFSYEVNRFPATPARQRLEEALKLLKPSSGTSLYDAIYLASRELQDRSGRRVIVVVTDGGDTTSAKTFHDALEAGRWRTRFFTHPRHAGHERCRA